MMTLNSVSTNHAEANERQYLFVVLEKRFDERIDRRQRAGGFPGRKDDEFLIILVIFNIMFVIFVVIIGG